MHRPQCQRGAPPDQQLALLLEVEAEAEEAAEALLLEVEAEAEEAAEALLRLKVAAYPCLEEVSLLGLEEVSPLQYEWVLPLGLEGVCDWCLN